MKKGLLVIIGLLAAFLLQAAGPLEADWEAVREARAKGLPRTATNVLARIETKARELKAWPDLAAVFVERARLAYGFTEESALKKEGPQGLVSQFAAEIETAPAEVRPMLRLALVRNYLSMSRSMRYWQGRRTRIAGAAQTNQPPWSAERLRPTLQKLLRQILDDAPFLQIANPDDWRHLLESANEFGRAVMPTLYDFAVEEFVSFIGEDHLVDRADDGTPTGLAADVLAALDANIAFHANDADRTAFAYAKFQRIDFVDLFAVAPLKEKTAKRRKAFEALAEEFFTQTWVSALAAERAGRLRVEEGCDLVDLHAYYLRFADKWPRMPGGDACRLAAQKLEIPSLSFQTERNWMAPWPDLKIVYKNLSRVSFRLVKIDVDDLAKDLEFDFSPYGHREGIEKHFARKPVRTWTVDVPPKSDYKVHSHTVKVPSDLPKGHYLLFASSDETFNIKVRRPLPIFQTLVTVTDLALVTDETKGRFSGFVFNAETGRPVADAKVELWTRDRRAYRRIETVKTADDGSFEIAKSNVYGGYLRAVKGKDEVISLSVSSWSSNRNSKEHERLSFVTDRGIYRPGQTVKFKGFAVFSNPEKLDYHTLADRRVFVTFRDPNGERVGGLALMSNAYGSFSGEFVIPRDRLTGAYELSGELVASGSNARKILANHTIRVEEYKRPKFSVKINPMKEERLNAETRVTGLATTYTGLPVAHAKVEWRVRRSTCYPRWCRGWFRPSDSGNESVFAYGTATTDAKGEFSFTFTPTPTKTAELAGDPSFLFRVHAVVTDGSGEAHTAESSFEVGVVPWRVSVFTAQNMWITPQAPARLRMALHTLNGEPVPDVKGVVKVYALKGPDHVVRKPETENDYFPADRDPLHPNACSSLWQADTWPSGDCVGEYTVVSQAKENPTLDVKLPPGVYRAEYAVTAPNGKTVKDECVWHVIDPTAQTHAVKEPVYARVETNSVPVGGTMRLYWGSGYSETYCRVQVRRGEKTIYNQAKTEGAFCLELPVTEEMVGELSIETIFLRENRLYVEHQLVVVPYPDSHLTITRAHLTSKLTPGAKETWSFTVSGSNTNDVRTQVEMLAFLTDRSLDAFCPYDPWFAFSRGGGLFTPYRTWRLQHEMARFANWRGDWPRPWDGESFAYQTLLRARWQSAPIGLFEWVDTGWSGGMHRRGRVMCEVKAKYSMAAAKPMLMGAMRAEPAAVPAAAAAPIPESALDGVAAVAEEKAESLEEGETPAAGESPRVAPRKNLAETAFFLPHLTTDEKGQVTFSFTVPEALTGWKLTALAHDAALRTGVLRDDTIVTTKPLMVEPTAPRFAREGDRFRFPVKVTNTEEAPQTGTAILEFFDAESEQPVALVARGAAQSFTLGPKETKTLEFEVAIPDGCGYLRFVATAKGKAFSDGEEGFLPVLSKRIEVRESLPLQIKKAGVKTATFKELAASAESSTLRHAGLAVQVVSDPTWYAFLALPYLMEYPHECCEQVFGRYYANALAQHIARARPAYREVFEAWAQTDAKALKSPLELNEDLKQVMLDSTPWVNDAKDETRAKRHIGELFGSARLAAEQKRAVEKLEQNFNSGDDLWPWFPGGYGSPGVTMHILTGYARLGRLVGDASLVKKPSVCPRARKGLDAWMVRNIDERLAWCKRQKVSFSISSMDLRWLYLQSFDGSTSKHRDLLLQHLRKEWQSFGIAGQSLAALVLARGKDKELAHAILASLKERAVRSDEFGLYWKRSTFFDCSLFAAPVSDQALAMEAFAEIEPDDWQAYEDARLWLLEQKRTQNWSTTVSTVDAVYAILLGDGSKKTAVTPAKEDVVTVKLGGVEVPRVGVEAGTGFYEYRFDPKAISSAQGTVELARQEDKLGWASLNWTYLEDVTKVKAFEQTGLRLTKTYFKKTLVAGKVRLVALNGGEILQPGDELVARLAIDSDRVYEYAHLRDERPATAEPVDVLSYYRWQDGLGFYQSTRDTATHYYFDRLPKGDFVLETSFRVRQQGVFASGIASLQCMYAPEFGAHSNATIIEVKR
ncbi:MAG: MG2 domain-containing protein [Kiritimatiellae bacterium]|nr:MG2 domain-containing protein [Kiritimatiellia bacterium]